MAGLSLFIFKQGSRNHADQQAKGNFVHNYAVVFGMRLPIMDTVDEFLRGLSPLALEALKVSLVRHLLEKKVLQHWKLDEYFLVCVDGTGVGSYDYEPFTGCPHKTHKSGKTTWMPYVLEAKLVCSNGLVLSLCSLWLDNGESLNDKQDCETKAFVRLAAVLKKTFPRLPVVLLADSLYANQTVFGICRNYGWHFIITQKDTVLKTVWQEVELLLPLHPHQCSEREEKTPAGWLSEHIRYINGIPYHQYLLNWVGYTAKLTTKDHQDRFCHLTDMPMDKKTAWIISRYGRQRWSIENEGFNTQKNGGYNMEHKYSRKNINARKNYYNLLQIGHLINQLVEKLSYVRLQAQQDNITLANVWEDMMGYLRADLILVEELQTVLRQYKQLRY